MQGSGHPVAASQQCPATVRRTNLHPPGAPTCTDLRHRASVAWRRGRYRFCL